MQLWPTGESVSADPCSGEARWKIQAVEHAAPARDPVLINALRTAHRLIRIDRLGLPTVGRMPQSRYAVRIMRLAFLSPRIRRDIIAGRQPPRLRLEDLVRCSIPLCWEAQERMITQA